MDCQGEEEEKVKKEKINWHEIIQEVLDPWLNPLKV
jgi:hypothetical protein